MDAADILDAFGKDVIFLETVGVGQSEVDIAGAADCTVVVLVPESGDGVQAMKAGLMEVADIFVLNKADRPMAERAVQEIEAALDLKERNDLWNPPVVSTIANRGEGLDRLMDTIGDYRDATVNAGFLQQKRLERRRERVRRIVERDLGRRMWTEERKAWLEEALHHDQNPFQIAAELVEDFLKRG